MRRFADLVRIGSGSARDPATRICTGSDVPVRAQARSDRVRISVPQRSLSGNDLPVLFVSYEDRRHDDTPISGPEAVINAVHRRLVAQWPHRRTVDLHLGACEPRREFLLVNGRDRGAARGQSSGCVDKVRIGGEHRIIGREVAAVPRVGDLGDAPLKLCCDLRLVQGLSFHAVVRGDRLQDLAAAGGAAGACR
jgi:hypothetical protein